MKKTLPLLLALVVLLCAAACGQPSQVDVPEDNVTTQAEAPTEKEVEVIAVMEDTGFERVTEAGTLTVGTTGNVYGFDPVAVYNTYGMELVCEQLIARDLENGGYKCLLCESYELTDPTTAVFRLRDNVYFSNGDKLVASDVLFSVSNMFFGGARTASNYAFIDFDNSYCEDDLTVVFKFKYEYGAWESAFGISYIVSESASAAMTEDDYWDKPVGTGPYSVTENVSGSHTSYALREDYWNKDAMPEAKAITVRNYSDTATMFIDFENGVLDVVTNIAVSDVERLVNGEVTDCTYAIKSLPDNILIAFNNSNEYLQNENVRAAICYGVDFRAVGETAKSVMYKEATSSLPSDLPYYANVGQYEYDPELAQQYMDASGYAPGEVSLRFVVVNNGVNPVIAECVQAYLAELGIEVVIEAYDMQTAISHYREGDTDLSPKELPTGVTTGDPQGFFSTMQKDSTNVCVKIADEEFQALLDEATYSSDTAVRAAAYEKVQQWLVDNYWDPAVCEACACYAYRNYIDSIDGVSPLQLRLREVSFAD